MNSQVKHPEGNKQQHTEKIKSMDIYVPVPSSKNLNIFELEQIEEKLCDAKEKELRMISMGNLENIEVSCKNIILAIVDSNSTILYYKLTKGLLDLDSLK